MAQIQTLVEALRSGMADIRAGVTGAIDKVTGAADLLTNEINKIQDDLAQLDSNLAALEALSIRMQQVIPGILLAIAVILSLIFAYILFTQVEVIRLYVARWRLLGQPEAILRAEALTQPIQEEIGGTEDR
jgi:hypothetical protein